MCCVKVGALVEAKHPDGQFMEAVISKLTDASFYTVGECEENSFITEQLSKRLNETGFQLHFVMLLAVFDDGDERTLRRTSLCLKGERHFNESEVGEIILSKFYLVFVSQ